MALRDATGSGIKIKVEALIKITAEGCEVLAVTIYTFFDHLVAPSKGEAAATHMGIRFNYRNFKLGVSHQISCTKSGNAGTQNDYVLSFSAAAVWPWGTGMGV